MSPTPAQLEAVRLVFEENFSNQLECGAAVSVCADGVEVLSLHAGNRDREGTPWEADTLAPVWSATKGPAATCTLLALAEAKLRPKMPVADIWPEFARNGKESVTLRQLLSHQVGFPALDRVEHVSDHAAVVAAICEQKPHWEPGSAHGYHPRTIGTVFEELVRRLSGASSLGEFWQERFARPMGLEFWIGLPPEQHHRVATLLTGKLTPDLQKTPFMQAFSASDSLTRAAFASPQGLASVTEMNKPESWAMGFAGFGGVGTAQALAKFYAMLAGGGRWQGQQILPSEVLPWMTTTCADGDDRVLIDPTAFSLGFMKDPLDLQSGVKIRRHLGNSRRAFGHPGAGGSLAFADPENGISFAYIMNQMGIGALPGKRAVRLVEALYAE